MKILYIGTKHFKYKKVKSVIETLEPLFREYVDIKTCSNKKSKIFRFLDMLYFYFRYGLFYDRILIDVYSTNAFYYAYVFSILSIIFKKKYILFLHGGNLPYRYKESTRMVNLIFVNAHKIVSPSDYLGSFFTKSGYNVEIVPNIINIDYYPFFKRKKIRPKILAIRGFDNTYNPIMTLKAIKLLKKEIHDINLLMLGNPTESLYNDVKKYISKNSLEKNIVIKNKLPLKQWVELSKDYDIMVSNPNIDNTPVSLIEGMALGMCLISSNVGGVPFLVEKENCILIENNNVKELTKSIKFLINNHDFASKMSLSARKKAKKYTWNAVKNKWKSILFD